MSRRKLDIEHNLNVAYLHAGAVFSTSQLGCDLDSFVAVRGTENGDGIALWTGKVFGRLKHPNGHARHLKARWYEQYDAGDALNSKYHPWFVKVKRNR